MSRRAGFRARRAAALALGAAALLGACRENVDAGRGSAHATTVGIVLGTGGRGDKGFNDAGLAGAGRAARDLGADTSIAQNVSDEGRAGALGRYAEAGNDLVVGISFTASQPTFELSGRYPKVRFAVLDYSAVSDAQGRALPIPSNLAAVIYRSEEGAYLAGALAGMRTATRKVGFIGGMDAPLIREFEAGYTAGVREVCPDCRVVVDYTGKTPAAFNDPVRGRALALAQYAAGVDVIFHASGGTGAGVFSAAREAPPGRWVIGVDVDQSAEAPGRVLTSVTKNLDVSLFGLIRDVKGGTFHGGLVSQGLSDGAVGYVYDARNKPLIPDSAYYRVETLRQAIIAGLIKVPKVPAAVR